MRKKKRTEWKRDLLSVLFYFMLLLGIGLLRETAYQRINSGGVLSFDDGWTWERTDGTEIPVTVGKRMPVEAGSPFILKNWIPEYMDQDMTLCFWSAMETVRVWADGDLIYEYGIEEEADRFWNNVYIPVSRAGQEITIEKVCPYRVYVGQTRPFAWGNYSQIQSYLVRRYFPEFLMGLFLMEFGIGTMIAAFVIMRRGYGSSKGIYLGIFILAISIWICGESRMPIEYEWFNSIKLSCIILMSAAAAYLFYMKQWLKVQYNKGYYFVLAITIANALINISLDVSGVLDLIETLPVTHAVLVVEIGFVSYIWIQEWKRRERNNKISRIQIMKLFSTVGLILAVITEGVLFYVDQYNSSGVYVQGALLLYILIYVAGYISESIENMRKSELLARQLEENRLKMMVSQIKPHFLYNTLLAIQELCYTAPEKAADTIVTFADFLRSNMNFMEEESLIPFSRELRNVKNYMEIQKVRFGEELEFKTEIQCMDFMIPPLSVQPIVENAVQHGVRGYPGGSKVKLMAYREDGWVVIITEDDGAGFDPYEEKSAEGFSALNNVKMRIEELLGGKMSIESGNGCGTKVTIKLPYQKEGLHEGDNS
ncbi:histidine kinase [Lacrimispora sp. NSJ-141]|uniref:Histidine kinase n=1 Tax=Lientehia hominis TaxID=2897778 RepID=A0AAP2WAE9_9FIRM|nr:histidine kinase [Lientehia hominis]MCD2493257.1 histidine kinase [Lientehia hominis]